MLLLHTLEGADSVELKLTVPEPHQRSTIDGARARPARRADPPGLLLRHARPRARRARRRRPRAPDPGKGRRLDRQAAPGRAERAARRSCGARPASASRSTRCPAGSSARRTLKGTPRPGRRAGARRRRKLPLRKLFSKEQRAVLSPRMRRKGSGSTTSRSSGRSSSSSCASTPAGARPRGSSPRCGSTRTARASSSSRRGARRPRRSRSRPRLRAFLARARRRPLRRAGDEDAQGARVLRAEQREAA